MQDKPLLIFRAPDTTIREKKKLPFGYPSYHFPDFSEQKDRLTPQFETMLNSFIVDTADGLEPERVLVIETVGRIDDFQRAVRAIPGLEWLVEIDEDSIEPDNNFYQNYKIKKSFIHDNINSISKKQSSQIWTLLKENNFINTDGYLLDRDINEFKIFIPVDFLEHSEEIIKSISSTTTSHEQLNGRLFLSMSNIEAINKLLSLWNQWDSSGKTLPRPYGKWTEIFKQTKTIRKWDTQDRLRDTGIIDCWKNELEMKKGTASKITFEIELWYRDNECKRQEAQNKISNLIYNENGKVITFCTINKIRFHAIKAELPPESIEKVLNSKYTKLFTCDDVMLFRPVGQCKIYISTDSTERELESGNTEGKPIVAILDGLPFVQHKLLKNRLIIDDPDDFESNYQVKARKHGTAMASLVCHGELDTQEEPLKRPIYLRPIMKPDLSDYQDPPRENIPKEYFMEDLIERSVRRIFEGDTNEKAVAPTIKVINLSIANSAKMFFNQLSSCSKLLDWLSYEYKVLFCVSAGNINLDIDIPKSIDELRSLSNDELVRYTILKIHDNIRNRKILSPAESINSITVGSVHSDSSTINHIGNRIDILPSQDLPSPISAHGLGYKNSIKPELYINGGRQLYECINNTYELSSSGLAPGQNVATVPVKVGEINRCVYVRGTSNSTALATRAAAQIYEILDSLILKYGISIDQSNIAVILKTLLIHSASWGEGKSILESILKTSENSKQFKKIIARYMGFGIPKIDRVVGCTSQRVTLLGYGKIKKDGKHDFKFPLPPSLSGTNVKRRLIITLAWFSPINSANRKYRKANLSIEPPTDGIGVTRINADWQQVKNGTVQHEVLEGDQVVSYQDGIDDALNISVVCREDADGLDEEVPYALAVTLEIGENINLSIYEEVETKISIPTQEVIKLP